MGFWFWVLALAALVVWLNLRGASRRAARSASRPAAPSRLETARLTIDLSVPSDPASSQASVAIIDLDAWMAGLAADDLRLVEHYGIKRTSQGFFCRHRRFDTVDRVLDHARALQSGAAVAPPAMDVHSISPSPRPDRADQNDAIGIEQPPSANFPRPDNVRPRWYGSAEPIEIGGVRIASPMIYVGPTRSYDTPRDRVDPTARVGLTGEDQLGIALSYWPSYHALSPGGRRTYLDWLAGGRTTRVGIGYVFIFFYGLERRLFVDNARAELDVIIAEVERLYAQYQDNNSFHGYAKRLLTAARLVRSAAAQAPELSPDLRAGDWEMPLSVRRYLGGKLATGEALQADDCLLWILGMPDTYLGAAGRRCFPELTELWRHRFAQLYPEGIKVRAPKRPLSAQYRAASSEFQVNLSIGDLPDIAALTQPVTRLRDLLLSWQSELDALSRLLLKRPDARDTLEGALCLPSDTVDLRFGERVGAVRAAMNRLLGDAQMSSARTREVLALLEIEDGDDKLPVTLQRHIAVLLDRLGFAFEPDRRHTEASLNRDGTLVLFKGSTGAPAQTSATFIAARTLVEIALLAAASDGEVVPAELDQVATDLAALPELSTDERRRLSAHALWLSRDPPRLQAALKRLGALPAKATRAATQAAVSTVLADGRVLPVEVRFLEKLHKALGLPQDEAYAALHRGTGRADEPVTVAAAECAAGVPLPPEADAVVAFDATRLARIREETSQVSALLTSIFIEDPVDAMPARAVATSSSRFEGLDARHADLLSAILTAGRLDQDAFAARARDLKLLPGGALETINEWAFEIFDEALLEEDDDIYPASHLRDRLSALENAA